MSWRSKSTSERRIVEAVAHAINEVETSAQHSHCLNLIICKARAAIRAYKAAKPPSIPQ